MLSLRELVRPFKEQFAWSRSAVRPKDETEAQIWDDWYDPWKNFRYNMDIECDDESFFTRDSFGYKFIHPEVDWRKKPYNISFSFIDGALFYLLSHGLYYLHYALR